METHLHSVEQMTNLLIKHDSMPLKAYFAEHDIYKAMQEYAETYSRERVEALEKQSEFFNTAHSNLSIQYSREKDESERKIKSLESKLSTLEERLKAADEVIKYGIPEGMYEHFELEKALEKYNSLKQKV